eukprot:CFRG2001T1
MAKPTTIYGFSAIDIDGDEIAMSQYEGKVVVAVNFGGQEPGSDADIKKFAQGFGVEFPMFSKIDVNGSDAHPMWDFMKGKLPGILGLKGIKWNFTKFLMDRNGVPIKRFGPRENPESMIKDIEKLL